MRRIGSELALANDRRPDPSEQLIQCDQQAVDLLRRVSVVDGIEGIRRPHRHLLRDALQRHERMTDDRPDQQTQDRQREQQRGQGIAGDVTHQARP